MSEDLEDSVRKLQESVEALTNTVKGIADGICSMTDGELAGMLRKIAEAINNKADILEGKELRDNE